MKEIIEQELMAKAKEHAELSAKEIELSTQVAFVRNKQWRLKKLADRKLASQRAARVLREIEGLASILTGEKYESQAT